MLSCVNRIPRFLKSSQSKGQSRNVGEAQQIFQTISALTLFAQGIASVREEANTLSLIS
jgi:hypothetical protein